MDLETETLEETSIPEKSETSIPEAVLRPKNRLISAISTPERRKLRTVETLFSQQETRVDSVTLAISQQDLKLFDATPKSIHPETFVRHLAWLKQFHHLSDDQIIDLLPKCLAKGALDWYYSLKTIPETLEEFTELFLQRFYSESLQNARQVRLSLLKQNKRPIYKYEREFTSLSKSLNLSPEDNTRQFFAGLNKSNQRGLLSSLTSNPNVDELTELAKTFEQLNFRPKNSKRKFHKKRGNHFNRKSENKTSKPQGKK